MPRPPQRAVEQCNHDLIPLDKAILAVLADETRASPRLIQHHLDTDAGRSWVGRRLRQLSETGPVEKIDRGLYELDLEGMNEHE